MAKEKKIPVVELFGPTLQGEGALIGTSSHFVRTGGCPRKCVQCDSLHAVLPEKFRKTADYITPTQIADRILGLAPAEYVTFSGGDPLMWKGLGEVIGHVHVVEEYMGVQKPLKFAVETQGDLWQDWLMLLDHVTVSPKAPGMDPDLPVNWDMLDRYVKNLEGSMCFKVVVFTRQDLLLVEALHAQYNIPLYVSVGTDIREIEEHNMPITIVREDILVRMNTINGWLQEAELTQHVRLLPQMHVLIWGTQKEV